MLRPTLRVLWLVMSMAGVAHAQPSATDTDLGRIKHILVIYAENRGFDHLYGLFPGANGIANATDAQKTQLDHDGTPLPYLTVWKNGKPDERFPAKLPNGPFRIDADPINARLSDILPSPVHLFYHNAEQINGGRNDMFA